jgi:hypothetical protein
MMLAAAIASSCGGDDGDEVDVAADKAGVAEGSGGKLDRDWRDAGSGPMLTVLTV